MRRKIKYYIILLILIIITCPAIAEEEDDTDFQTWMDFRTIYMIDDIWTYDGNYGIRGVLSGEDWRRYYIHPAFIYHFKLNMRFRGGIRFIFTEEYSNLNTFEIRPWQGVSLNWPKTSWFTINNYFRMEQRFTMYSSSEVSNDFALRFRYRIQAKTPTIRIIAINQNIYFLANYEIFINIGKAVAEKYVNRGRLSLGMGVYFSKTWWFELIYANQSSRRNSEEGIKTRENILRFRLRFKIN